MNEYEYNFLRAPSGSQSNRRFENYSIDSLADFVLYISSAFAIKFKELSSRCLPFKRVAI